MKNLRERRLAASTALFLSASALAACSDEWAPHPDVVLPPAACPGGLVDAGVPVCFDIIADFDNGQFNFNDGRSGGWFSYDDHSLNGPDGGPTPQAIGFDPRDGGLRNLEPGQAIAAHPTFPSMAPSTMALHAHAGSYSGSYGSGVGTNLNSKRNTDGVNYHAEPYDASRYDGIILWAKHGGTPGVSSSVRVQITTVATDSNYASEYGSGKPLYNATGQRDPRICDPNATTSTLRCDDDYSIVLSILSDWGEPFKIPWANLHTQGYGRVPPEGFSPAELVTVKFTNPAGQAFDEWFDDIAFYKE